MVATDLLLSAVQDPTVWLVFTLVFLTALLLSKKKRTNLPPGPKPLPIVGNLPLLAKLPGKYVYSKLLSLRVQYGDIVRLQFGPWQDVVVLFGKKTIREALIHRNADFRFRPVTLFPTNHIFNQRGVFNGNGEMHTALKKFTIVSLRDFGVGKTSLETKIHEEASLLCGALEKLGGKPATLTRLMQQTSANVIAVIVYGSRFEYDDPQFHELMQDVGTFFKVLSLGLPEVYLPFLRHLPTSKLRVVFSAYKRLEKYGKSQINEHRLTFDPNNIRDFVDYYIQLESSGDKYLTEDNLFRVIVDLFNAGTDTTSNTLNWSIFLLCKYPQIQDKCRQEIHKVFGTGRLVSIADKGQLPYFQATITEIFRITTVAPTCPPRAVMKDTEFQGYTIPKDTVVLCHINSVLLDPEEWEDPEEFKPERFLDKDGKPNESAEAFMPFGLGSRMCLGRHLVKMELLIFLGTLLQRFDFRFPAGCPSPPIERVQTGLTCMAPPFEACITPL